MGQRSRGKFKVSKIILSNEALIVFMKAVVCAILSSVFPNHRSVFKAGYTSALAAKLGDTFSSEIGKAIGKRTLLITSLKPVPRGTEGAVSLEGSISGVVAIFALTKIALVLKFIESKAATACVTASIIANILESFIGATWQGDNIWLTNDTVNVLNTATAAILTMLLSAHELLG